MKIRPVHKLALVLFLAFCLVPFAAIQSPVAAHPPLDATPVAPDMTNPRTLNAGSCARDPKNLIYNGSMGPVHDTAYGTAADGWAPFIFSGTPPNFRWVDNEQIDPNGSQQIYSSNTFDAGIQQTVSNLQPGVYYWLRLGYSLAAKSYSGPNVRVDSIGRKVGVDPYGGSDPKSPNVIWGPDLFDGSAALNRPEMVLIFPARADHVTVFLRAMARDGSNGENRVWLDAVCMEPRYDMATATPLAPTATLVPPTATHRPALPRAATKAPAVGVARTATSTPTRVPAPTQVVAMVAPVTPTPLQVKTPTAIPTPRYARPVPTPAPAFPIELGTGLLAGVGVTSIMGSFLLFGFGIVLAKRIY